jgi:translation initiation factor IF-1
MPKNTTGGKGTKKQANKWSNFIQRAYNITSELEVEGYVEKILGNGMIRVNSVDGKHIGLICTIRGKFKGRNKSSNKIEPSTMVVVGLREWESPHKTGDLLFVCNELYKTETDECGEDENNKSRIDFTIDFTKTTLDTHTAFEQTTHATTHATTDATTDYHDIDIDDI